MQDFPGNLLVNNSTAGVMSLIPEQGTKIPHAARCGKKKKKKTHRVDICITDWPCCTPETTN